MKGMRVFAGTVAVAAIVSSTATKSPSLLATEALDSPVQSYVQRRVQEYLVTFEFQQTETTEDQVTIIFSNAAVDPRRIPAQVFGDDIVAEFSFSGLDFQKGPVRFSRRVRDKSFLDCRYIRVVNHGTDRWAATTISLSVDGQTILPRVSMTERKGGAPAATGLERWNRKNWGKGPVYWEGELQRYRPRAAS